MPTTITVNSHTAIADNGLLARLCSICAVLGLAIGLLVLAGYAADFSPAWRLAPGLPATHPLSALSIALLGGGMLGSFARRRPLRLLARGAVAIVAAIVTLRILAPWIGLSAFNAITPFGGVIAAQAAAGTPISMGPNSAQTFLAIAVAEMLRWKNRPTASQLLAGGALVLLFVALIGYIDDLHVFYGRMAPVTLLGGFTLAVSVLLATHRRGFVRALVARSEPGQVARRLLVPSTSLILLMGWATVHYGRIYGMSVQSSILLAYQTAAIIILSWILVTAATVRADFIDRRRQAAEALLLKAATTDALTGLLSRNELERFRAAGEAAQPERSRAELLIDLDRFRAVNEAFGHEVGDAFLVEIAQRLQQVGKSYPVGRLGGDEFAIYCTGITSSEAEEIGMAVIAILAMPFNFQGRDFRLTASVGVSYSEPAGQIDLRAAADSAMHVAKNRGGNQVVTFHGAMVGQRRAQIELEQYLHAALDHDEQISLAYQPIVKLSDRSLVAVEALARWVHPLAGLIPPETFIPLAEATGLILPLGWKLMTIAVAQAALWRDQHGDRAPRININISPLQFANGDIIADLKSLLDRHRLSTSAICIEVTEGAFSDNGAIRSLEKARDMGFKVAMDDFGVGYSSLGQLPRLPLATVKLDRSFIVDSTETTRGAIMLASIVQLAHDLNLTVVAEGVETQAQLALVTQVGCDAVQGYFYARPMQGAALEAWLTEKAPRAMRQAEA